MQCLPGRFVSQPAELFQAEATYPLLWQAVVVDAWRTDTVLSTFYGPWPLALHAGPYFMSNCIFNTYVFAVIKRGSCKQCTLLTANAGFCQQHASRTLLNAALVSKPAITALHGISSPGAMLASSGASS